MSENIFNSEEIYTVSDFLSLCNTSIENNIPTCWLQGEISNFSRPASGHWYFSLKDNQGQIRCALFRLNQRNIKFSPENGVSVLLRAAPSLYQARGDFQLIIQHIEPVGIGNLQLAFEQLKTQLKNEGLFAATHKKPLPTIVNTIGIISSSNGAVIQDIIKVLRSRYPFATVLLFDCVVQGEEAAEKLAAAVLAADKSNRCEVLIIARGGGSTEDLWAFNKESLARAIFAAKTPIISAIGHETDTTIADFVADVRAPTPSAAAVVATPDRLELLAKTNKLYADLYQFSQQNLSNYQSQLRQFSLNMPNLGKQFNTFAQRVDILSTHLNYQIRTKISLNRGELTTIFEQLKQHSPSAHISHKQQLNKLAKIQLKQHFKHLIEQHKNHLHILYKQLQSANNNAIEWQKNILANHALGLEHLSPLGTLSRGYTMTMLNNQLIDSITKVKIGDSLTTIFNDGKIHTRVRKIEKK